MTTTPQEELEELTRDLYLSDKGRHFAMRLEKILAALSQQAAQEPQPVAWPDGFSAIKHVDGHGWVITAPNGSKWVAFEDTPVGAFISALCAAAPAKPAEPAEQEKAAHDWCKCGDDRKSAAMHGTDRCQLIAESSQQAPSTAAQELYYIAAFHRRSEGVMYWWGPDHAGYTPDLETAGIYSAGEAAYITKDDPQQVAVPVSFIKNLRVRRTVDYGDSKNTMFWTPYKLRAALAHKGAQGDKA